MLNDVHEPPLEPEYEDRRRRSGNHGHKRAEEIDHPVLKPGEPIVDSKLYEHSVPEHNYIGGIAYAIAAGVLVLIFLAVLWAWFG